MTDITDSDLWDVIQLLVKHGSRSEAARAIGIPRATLEDRLNKARNRWPDVLPPSTNRPGWAKDIKLPSGPPGIERVVGPEHKSNPASTFNQRPVPFSQDQSKITVATREECVDELWRIVKENPDAVISRNYFRVNSKYAESAWNVYWGTWAEFKRQAGIVLTRHAHRLERNIAKHASVDILRELNTVRAGYEGQYLKPNSNKFQTLIHVTDLHDKECDPFVLRILVETTERIQPEKIIIGGDLFDLAEFGKYSVDPREWDVVGRIQAAHNILRQLREAAPNTEMILVEGNHEYRLVRNLAEATPALMVVLADLHGMNISKLLGLDKFEVNYIARCDLGAFRERDIAEELNRNYYIAWDAYLVHHFPHGERMGYHGGNGHHHRHWVHQHYSPDRGPYHWTQLGCCHRRLASYTAAEQWGLGFNIAHVNTHTKHCADEYIHVQDHAMVGGRFYEREDNERA